MIKKITPLRIIALLAIIGTGLFVYFNINQTVNTVDQSDSVDTSKVAEVIQSSPESIELSGQFNGVDAVHKASGTASVVVVDGQPVLKFSDDFSVTNGPDLFVNLYPNTFGDDGEFVSLGKLQSINGAQVYNLPDDYKNYQRVTIWCRAFSFTFANAPLESN